MYSEEELKTILDGLMELPVETEWVEFKTACDTFSFEKLGKYFSALSNEANLYQKPCGWLILGVSDASPRRILGSQYKKDPKARESLKHEVAKHTNGITFRTIYELYAPEGRVLLFEVPPAPAGIPVSWQGHYYGRDGESLVALSLEEQDAIRSQSPVIDWSAEICPEASIGDLHEAALAKAKKNFLEKISGSRLEDEADKWSDEVFLEKAKLARKGALTRAAILLLGKPEALHYLLPHPAQITWKLDADEEAYEHFGPPFLLAVEEVYKRIRNVRFRIQPFNRLIPEEMTKYEPEIILEALNNCIAHQDYTQNARIIVTEKTDRLLLQNNGSFFDGSVNDYVLHERTPERYRNPLLAQAMVHLNMIDTMGQGIRRMFMEQRRRFFPLPEFDLSDGNHVQLTIYGKVIDENYTRVLMEKQDLDFQTVIALDKIQKKETIDRQTVQMLKKLKLVEGRYPNIFVSAQIAQATDKKVEYTRQKAFDEKYYCDMIVTFLKQHKKARPEDFQQLLMEKLSDLLDEKKKKTKIRNLLQKMARKQVIENIGSRGCTAEWRLKNSS